MDERYVYLHVWKNEPFDDTYTVHEMPIEGDQLKCRIKVPVPEGKFDE